MKTITLILVTLFLGSDFTKPENNSQNPSGFKVIKDVEGIRLSARWIPVTSTRSVRQIRCELVVDGPVMKVVSTLYDDISVRKWMKSAKEYYRVKTIDASHWASYVQFQIPWPLNNQDCILRYEVSKDASGRKILINVTGDPGFLKCFEGVNRIPHMEGSWILTDLGNKRVHVEYTMYSSQAPKFPRWLTDPIIQNNMIEMMVAFRSTVHEQGTDKLSVNGTR